MKRQFIALISGTALAAVAALAACSGSGSGTSPTPPSLGSTNNSGNSVQATANGMKMVLTFNRSKPARLAKTFAKNVARRAAKSVRQQPKYISYAARGLQIAVTATAASGPVTKTVYADISNSSPLCTQDTNGVVTCTLTVPTLAASETITATEVDNPPTAEVVTGSGAGYGTGFPATSDVLGATSTTVSTTPGTTSSIIFGIDPVMAGLYDCGFAATVVPTSQTANTAGYDATGGVIRIVVTAGFAQTTVSEHEIEDIDDCVTYFPPPPSPSAAPVPFTDVNGAPQPWTFTSSSQHVLVTLANPSVTTLPTTGFSTTASIANTSLLSEYNCVLFLLQIDSSFNAPATLTDKNNLSATTSFTGTASPYAFTYTTNIVPVSVTPTTANVTVTGSITADVTGSDYLATGGMAAYGAVDQNGTSSNTGACVDGSNVEHASVAADTTVNGGAISTTTWQQAFKITPMVAGTCTFVLADFDTLVVSPTITVTVNP